ncbi:MAPEG family protein [Aestuariirhabdus litorea]|uniref:MAPEG family protein n=1 Tax=Aestuariirhabdus litorea TaxID=2528527 RepID=A0A3P3VJS9_9GAMM|nr:MAPEG family protein [Aestuariirhabdus litorea]RRJ82975.1 MAPEG family protein [Aestuariirhabdus litorea]RWW93135.1 MAPEG family protein [Endozoicomonadaceae bacterium GTF-13]
MSVALYCLVAAALLIIVSKVPVALAMHQLQGYDNLEPRRQQARLEGWGFRALSAHQNSIEAFPLFAAGVLVAVQAGASPGAVDALAVTFVVARLIYNALYLLNLGTLRSLSWGVGLGCSLALMLSPLWGL